MKLSFFGKLLGIAQILFAVWYFNWQSWNQILVSVLLFLGGVITFLADSQSKPVIKLKNSLQVISGVAIVIFLIKLLFVG